MTDYNIQTTRDSQSRWTEAPAAWVLQTASLHEAAPSRSLNALQLNAFSAPSTQHHQQKEILEVMLSSF